MDNFQTRMSDYFANIAEFDSGLARTDLDDARGWYATHEATIKTQSDKVQDHLKDLFVLSLSMIAGEIAENTVNLAIQIANAFNPIKHLAEGAQAVLDVQEAAKKLMKSTAVLARIGRALDKQLPLVRKIRNRIAERRNETHIKEMKQILDGSGESGLYWSEIDN